MPEQKLAATSVSQHHRKGTETHSPEQHHTEHHSLPARNPEFHCHIVQDLSRWNDRRAMRPDTKFIILHTTEAPGHGKSSLDKLKRNGEANYMVDTDGTIYQIISDGRISKHAGKSLWNGVSNISNHSIGIEVVGTYSHSITSAQALALRDLLGGLKHKYHVSDDRVLTHSMVACGYNRWEDANVRGRKMCGTQFADPKVRSQLGLHAQPHSDPDVRAGKLKVINHILERALYAHNKEARSKALASYAEPDANVVAGERTPIVIAGDAYNAHSTTYIFPGGGRKAGDEISNWGAIPRGTRVVIDQDRDNDAADDIKEIGKHGQNTAWSIAGNQYKSPNTIYFLTNGMVRTGKDLAAAGCDFAHFEKGTKVLVGYTYGGNIDKERVPFEVVGKAWNYPSTFYRLPNRKLVSGDELDDGAIPKGTVVLFRN